MSFTLGNVAENWRRWEQQFEVYYKACELKKRDKAVQVAILLHAAGPEAQEIHETFVYEGEDDVLDYKKVLSQFRLYCNPRKISFMSGICFGTEVSVMVKQLIIGSQN